MPTGLVKRLQNHQVVVDEGFGVQRQCPIEREVIHERLGLVCSSKGLR